MFRQEKQQLDKICMKNLFETHDTVWYNLCAIENICNCIVSRASTFNPLASIHAE